VRELGLIPDRVWWTSDRRAAHRRSGRRIKNCTPVLIGFWRRPQTCVKWRWGL